MVRIPWVHSLPNLQIDCLWEQSGRTAPGNAAHCVYPPPTLQGFITSATPTHQATCLLLPLLGLVRKMGLFQLKKLNTPIRSFFPLWHKFKTCRTLGRLFTTWPCPLCLSSLVLPACGKKNSEKQFKGSASGMATDSQ